jgi:hypothetical protein
MSNFLMGSIALALILKAEYGLIYLSIKNKICITMINMNTNLILVCALITDRFWRLIL